jgi:hypothetical protein
MSDEKEIRKANRDENPSGPARARMSDAEKAEIRSEVHRAIERRDFPKFKSALLKLGLDEHSKQFG